MRRGGVIQACLCDKKLFWNARNNRKIKRGKKYANKSRNKTGGSMLKNYCFVLFNKLTSALHKKYSCKKDNQNKKKKRLKRTNHGRKIITPLVIQGSQSWAHQSHSTHTGKFNTTRCKIYEILRKEEMIRGKMQGGWLAGRKNKWGLREKYGWKKELRTIKE